MSRVALVTIITITWKLRGDTKKVPARYHPHLFLLDNPKKSESTSVK